MYTHILRSQSLLGLGRICKTHFMHVAGDYWKTIHFHLRSNDKDKNEIAFFSSHFPRFVRLTYRTIHYKRGEINQRANNMCRRIMFILFPPCSSILLSCREWEMGCGGEVRALELTMKIFGIQIIISASTSIFEWKFSYDWKMKWV